MRSIYTGFSSSRIPTGQTILAGLMVSAGLLAGIAGCNRASNPAATAPAARPQERPVITTVHPERHTIRRTITQPGYVQAFEQTPLYSKIPGYVQKVNVDKGDPVCKGMVLAVLWVPEMEVDVAQKQALVGQADAELKLAQEMVVVAQANVKSADAKVEATQATRLRAEAQLQRTQSQLQRFTKAGREGTIGGEDVEETRLAAKSAEAGLAEVKAQVQAAQAERDATHAKWVKSQVDVLVAQTHVDVARKNHEQSKTMLEYRNITGPFDHGVVTSRNIDSGHFVQPATGPRGEALFVVMRTDLMRVRVEVPEADADWVSSEATVQLRIPVLKSYQYVGKVARTSWSVDRTSHTLLAEIDVADKDGRLRPGMYAHATITAERPNVLSLPVAAVLTEGDVNRGYRDYCFVVENGKVRRTLLETGARDSQRVEVLKKQAQLAKAGAAVSWENLTGKEEVAQGNVSNLADGQPFPPPAPQ